MAARRALADPPAAGLSARIAGPRTNLGRLVGETEAALVALLQGATQQTWAGVEINSSAGDHLFLVGVSKQSLLAHASADVHIV